MREFARDGYDLLHDVEGDISKIDCCFLSNIDAPVVLRRGPEPFKSYYVIECCYLGCNVIDSSRSFAKMMIDRMNMENDSRSHWPAMNKDLSDVLKSSTAALLRGWTEPAMVERGEGYVGNILEMYDVVGIGVAARVRGTEAELMPSWRTE